jgi:hypothetical protein
MRISQTYHPTRKPASPEFDSVSFFSISFCTRFRASISCSPTFFLFRVFAVDVLARLEAAALLEDEATNDGVFEGSLDDVDFGNGPEVPGAEGWGKAEAEGGVDSAGREGIMESREFGAAAGTGEGAEGTISCLVVVSQI